MKNYLVSVDCISGGVIEFTFVNTTKIQAIDKAIERLSFDLQEDIISIHVKEV